MTEDKVTKMAVNGPVFYLVQEQAKSVVAIQALQTRMAVLESLQERLMQAIDDVHQHLASSKDSKSPATTSKGSTYDFSAKVPPLASSEKKLRFVETERSETVGTKPEQSKSDSLNKDSGIGGSESDSSLAPPNLPDDEDELLQLLELIDQKSLVLLKQIESAGLQEGEKNFPEMGERSNAELLDNLLFEKVDAQRQLSEVKAERDELKRRLAKLELATEAVTKQKIKVQQQLDATLVENQSLQEKIQKSSGDFSLKTESLGYMADIERANLRRKYLQYSEKSRMKVSSILKEVNVLELQKQLLTYVMENDILRAKLQQDEPSKMAGWLKIESQLRKELKDALNDRKQLHEVLQSKDLEIASLKDKIRELEELMEEGEGDSCVKNFGMGSTEDWREPGVQNAYTKRSNLHEASPFSPLGYGDFSKTQSLPAILLLGAQAKLKEDSERANYNVYDTGSFTEIPLNHSFLSEQPTDHYSHAAKDLVDLSSPAEPVFSSTSTLVQQSNYQCQQPTLHSGLSAPNLIGMCNRETLQNWAFAPRKTHTLASNGGAKLVNGHLCWKGGLQTLNLSASEDLSSICTEFDPLSDDTPSCENFVDSLNLSIPLKPTQVAMSQLSSIGDSLHSASLDMGCTSSPTLYQDMHNARSVDGIRELLIENGYCKRPSSSQYGPSSTAPVVLGKSGRNLPVNILNCMHEASDYSLL